MSNAEPLYTQIPSDEYKLLKKQNEFLKKEIKAFSEALAGLQKIIWKRDKEIFDLNNELFVLKERCGLSRSDKL